MPYGSDHNLRWLRERFMRIGGHARRAGCRYAPAAIRKRFLAAPQDARCGRFEPSAQIHELCFVAGEQFGLQVAVAAPGERGCGSVHVRGEIDRRAAVHCHCIHVASGRTEIAHDSSDECDHRTVARYSGHRELLAIVGGTIDHPRAGAALGEQIQLRSPPIIVAIARRGGSDEALAAGSPIVFIHIKIRGRDPAHHAFVQNRDALLRRRCIQVAGNRRAGLCGADFLGCILRGQHGESAIGHVAQSFDGAAEVEQLGQGAAVGRDGIHGTGVTARSSQGETEMLAVGTKGR